MKLGGRIVHHNLAAAVLLLAGIVGGEVGGDDLPRLPTVAAAEQYIATEVHRARVLRRELNGGVPVEAILVAQHRVTHRANAVGIRVDHLLRARATIGHINHAALRIGVDDPRPFEIGHSRKTVAAAHVVPVAHHHAGRAERIGRAAPRAVVLQTAADVVRLLIVVVDVIELRERKALDDLKVLTAVVAHLPAAVGALQNAPRINRVNPHGLVIAVHTTTNGGEVAPAVVGEVQPARQRPHAVGVLGVHANVRVVERPEVDVAVVVDHAPRLTGVVGAPQLPFFACFGEHVHDVRLAGAHGNTNAVHRRLGESQHAILARESLPGGATVHRLVHRRVAAAAVQVPRLAQVRVHAGVDDVAVVRVGGDVGAAGLRIHVEHLLPRGAAVGGFEHTALFVGSPFASNRAGVHDVGILSVHNDARDLV